MICLLQLNLLYDNLLRQVGTCLTPLTTVVHEILERFMAK